MSVAMTLSTPYRPRSTPMSSDPSWPIAPATVSVLQAPASNFFFSFLAEKHAQYFLALTRHQDFWLWSDSRGHCACCGESRDGEPRGAGRVSEQANQRQRHVWWCVYSKSSQQPDQVGSLACLATHEQSGGGVDGEVCLCVERDKERLRSEFGDQLRLQTTDSSL